MKILVTGGAGYIGSHTAKALARAGHEPVVFDNFSTGHEWAVQWGPLIKLDLADISAIRKALNDHAIDAVVHFAAYTYVGESMRDPGKYFQNNVVNSLNLLRAMNEAGVQNIVFSSSCAIYGMPEFLPITEEHSTNPASPYGESKLMVEQMLRWFGEIHDFKWIALRYFNAAGADPEGEIGEVHDPETHLIPLVVEAALNPLKKITVFGTDYPTPDGTAIRDYIHVNDLASAHVLAIESMDRINNQAFNLGTGIGVSVLDIVKRVSALSGNVVEPVFAGRRPGDPALLVADPGKAQRVLGWKPVCSDIEICLKTALAWRGKWRFGK
jgi:UDP-glucose-4-epimerase GalE